MTENINEKTNIPDTKTDLTDADLGLGNNEETNKPDTTKSNNTKSNNTKSNTKKILKKIVQVLRKLMKHLKRLRLQLL